MTGTGKLLRIDDLERWLPQRPPILMLDRVVEIDPGVSGVGVRRFEEGDACFAGHFPGRPLLPGVITIEAFAQTLMVVLLAGLEDTSVGPASSMGYLARVNDMSFRRPIEPGQEIAFSVIVEKRLGQFAIAACRATHGEDLCAKGNLAVAMDRQESREGE